MRLYYVFVVCVAEKNGASRVTIDLLFYCPERKNEENELENILLAYGTFIIFSQDNFESEILSQK